MSGMKDDADGLEIFFAAARAAEPRPSAALRAAVEDDAAAVLAGRGPVMPVALPVPDRSGGWLADLWRTLGGWPALGAMSAAAVAGVWVGLASPAALVPALVSGAAEGALFASDLYPTLDDLLMEL